MKIQEFAKERHSDGVISVTPMPTSEELALFYTETYYQETPSATFCASYSDEELAQRRLRSELVLFALAEAGNKVGAGTAFFEIGCGEGFLLHAAREQGCSVRGMDFSDVGLLNCNPHLRDCVETGDAYQILERMSEEEVRFDVCVMQNVLEHVLDPKTLLCRVHQLLAPGGIAVVTVPNDFSPVHLKLMEKEFIDSEFWFQPPQHLHYFNVDSVKMFAAHCGFDVVDAFADFPIDFFLFHPGSNYVRKQEHGKGAHEARIILDLLLAERGLSAYHNFCRSVSMCGAGRNVTVVLRPNEDEGVKNNNTKPGRGNLSVTEREYINGKW